jgi:hypothetical protein
VGVDGSKVEVAVVRRTATRTTKEEYIGVGRNRGFVLKRRRRVFLQNAFSVLRSSLFLGHLTLRPGLSAETGPTFDIGKLNQ